MQNDNNHKNLAAAILENGGYSSDTSLTIPTTSAATFPDVPFFATIMPTTDLANSNNSEIVEVTAASTSGSDTTFTISRGQRGTTAINWDAGKAVLVHAIYTEDVVYIDTTLSTPTNIAYVSEDNIQTGAVTTSKIANGAVTSQNIDWTTITPQVVNNITDYVSISTGVTINSQSLYRIGPMFIYLFDINASFGTSQTVVGTVSNKVMVTAFGSARLNVGTQPPAVAQLIPGGQFRIFATTSASGGCAGCVIFFASD